MPAPYLGSCLCGGVNIEIASEPVAILSCFCDHCSKGAGGTNQILAKFAEKDIKINTSGENSISVYTLTDTSSGSAKDKAFCKTCGVPLWTVPAAAKGIYLLIRTALLQNWYELAPKSEIFVKNRPAWPKGLTVSVQWTDNLRNTCTYNPAGGLPAERYVNLEPSGVNGHVRESLPTSRTPQGPESRSQSWLSEQPRSAPEPGITPMSNPPTVESNEGGQLSEDQASNRSHGPTSAISPSVINAMTAVVDEGTSTREYFGSSSAGSFTAQIKKAIDARLGKSSHALPNHTASRFAAPVASAAAIAALDANRVLPTRRQADRLMGTYWKYVDPLYPFFDRVTWEKQYSGIFNGDAIDIDERTFIATMNIIFALATQLQEPLTPEQREQASNIFFVRARELLPLNTWDPGSIELVQYLLLASQYLQSTDHPHETWMVVGSAIRIAQSLGLHLDATSADLSPNERDLLRRIWYGCVLMDRLPPPFLFLNNHNSKTPQAMQRSLSNERSRTYPSESSISGEHFEDLGMVIRLDRDLVKWERSLPEWLRCNTQQIRGEVTHRQAVVLNIRLLHARILLLRPILARFCLNPSEVSQLSDNVESRVIHQCAILCLATAQQLIAALLQYQGIDGTIGLLPAWWYRVYYVYTAATVLIAAKLRPDIFAKADLHRAWSQAMSVLKAHEGFGQSVRKCVTALHFLSSKIGHDGTGVGEAVAGDAENPSVSIDEDHVRPVEDFPFSAFDLDQQQLDDVQFDITNLAWLNDMHSAWDLINSG
ncbi:Sorbicillinoid biosynthetic cluster transcription factor sor3 [Paramyrothecium foliicola]|nr:Sorbicillinoid biosynthetic cluster transcription factor sor3 [Paramyrothecium foliicola]